MSMISGSGFSDGRVQKSKRFFALPHAQKMLAPHPPDGMHHRGIFHHSIKCHLLTTHSGYSAIGAEKVVQHLYDQEEILKARKKRADVKESFEVGREDDELMPNIWFPEDILPGFRETCLTFFWV